MRGLPMSILAITMLIAVVAGLLYATGSGSGQTTRPAEAQTRPAAGSATQPATTPATQPAKPQVVIDTNLGEIVVELDEQRTPATVKNFLRYVDDEFYEGVISRRAGSPRIFSKNSRPTRR
jgi:hypothetical protein